MKTECQHCGGHIEFDDDSAGLDSQCPHCGRQTRLAAGIHHITDHSLPPPIQRVPPVWRRRWFALALIAISLVTFGAVVAVCWVKFRLGPLLAQFIPGVAGILISLAVLVVVMVWAVLWIVFPVFMYFDNRRIIQLLEQIEAHVRRTR